MDVEKTVEKIRKGDLSDDEWLVIRDEIRQFLKEDHPEEEKKMFRPFGYLEMVDVICLGIERMRKSICYQCQKRQGEDSCKIYKESIPKEIWTVENGNCLYFEKCKVR